MSNNPEYIKKITELTMRLKQEHPDVYEHLDENPTTLQPSSGKSATDTELIDYIQTLQDLLALHEN